MAQQLTEAQPFSTEYCPSQQLCLTAQLKDCDQAGRPHSLPARYKETEFPVRRTSDLSPLLSRPRRSI
jgi:hypothetical protein